MSTSFRADVARLSPSPFAERAWDRGYVSAALWHLCSRRLLPLVRNIATVYNHLSMTSSSLHILAYSYNVCMSSILAQARPHDVVYLTS